MEDLAPYASLSIDELIDNKEKRTLAERYFQLMVDEAIDINAALAYQLGGKIADAYKSTFFELVPLGIINQSFADAISESAKIRNQLTHDYDKLSKQVVAESVKKFFDMYKIYAKIITEKFLL
jgi:uncharacterized protein YutE (UPF0331/DUF86 family)